MPGFLILLSSFASASRKRKKRKEKKKKKKKKKKKEYQIVATAHKVTGAVKITSGDQRNS